LHVILYGYRRNKEMNTEEYIRPSNQVHHILQNVRQYHMAENSLRIVENQRKSIVQVKWLPPLNCWVKLNRDGSCQDDGRVGCDGVIRGSDGEWLGGFANVLGYGNAYLAELWGVLEGLKHAKRLNFRAVELHIDSLVVVQNITAKRSNNIVGRTLVERIRKHIDLDWEVVVHHSYREANFCADALANHGCLMEHGSVFFTACPSKFSHLLLADVMGIATPRLVSL
jgi:ribonuclease HI